MSIATFESTQLQILLSNRFTKALLLAFVSLALLVAVSASLLSQQPPPATATGTLSGKVSDAATGDVLRGATVFIVGTKKGGIVDVKGTYSVKAIPVGTYSVKINYIGFKQKTVDNVEIKANQTFQMDVVLESAIKKTEEVVVEVKRLNDNAAAMLAQRKNATQVSDGISEAEIKKLPDSDAGQALRRVSGVTLSEGKFVYVRGVSERYNSTTLNGAGLSSTEPDKKAFAFDMFPAEFLQNANVAKSFTPDLPGNFVGGLVQLNTIDFPEAFAIRVNVSSSFNDNVTFKSNNFQSYEGGGRDWLGMDDGTRALPANIPANRYEMDKLSSQAKSFFKGGNTANQSDAERWASLGQAFNSSTWKRNTMTAAPNTGFGVSFSNIFNVADNDFGIIASLTYSNAYSINLMERLANGGYNDGLKDFSTKFKFEGTQSTRSVNWGGLLNLAYKLGGSNSISLKNIYNRSSDDEVIFLEGFDDLPKDVRLVSYQFVQKELISTQLSGEHTVGEGTNLLFDWRLGYSRSTRDEPDFRRLRYSRDRGTNDPYVADISPLQQGDGTQAGRFFSNLKENVVTGGANITLPLNQNQVKLKGGVFFENRNRDFTARSFTIIQSHVVTNGAYLNDNILTSDPAAIFKASNFGRDGLGISEDSKPTDSYTAKEQLYAGFAMIETPFTIGDSEWRFVGGLRVESNSQNLASPYSFKPNSNTPDSLIATNRSTLDLLPSLNLLYKISTATNLRFSASQTLTRPTLREIAPFSFYDFQTLSVVRGNPTLKRALIKNFDMRYEIFPEAGEVISVGAFYKIFTDAIENTITPTSSGVEKSFANAEGNATNYGVEFELRKGLAFLSSDLSNFLFNANLALVSSDITVKQGTKVQPSRSMQGQSPYSLNIGIYFTDPNAKTSINVAYNISGKKIAEVGLAGSWNEGSLSSHTYELPRSVIDVSVIQPLFENAFEIKFAVRDLLNMAQVREQFGKQIESNVRGRNFNLSFAYRFR